MSLIQISGIVKEVEELLIRKNLAPANSTLKLQEQISKQIINERNVVEAITDVIYHQRNMTERQCPSPECFDIEQVLPIKNLNIVCSFVLNIVCLRLLTSMFSILTQFTSLNIIITITESFNIFYTNFKIFGAFVKLNMYQEPMTIQ